MKKYGEYGELVTWQMVLLLTFLIVVIASTLTAVSAAEPINRSPQTVAAINYRFTAEEEALLTEIQRGCFEFLWNEVGDPVPLVVDRLTERRVSSLAGVGFQLSTLPIGVERGWITRQQGQDRAENILKALVLRDDNKKHGIYQHYVDPNTGGMHFVEGMQVQASTVDHALLQAGAMAAAVYFDGEVNRLVDQLVAEANWKIYQRDPDGYISFGWRPKEEVHDMSVDGDFLPWTWHFASAEEQIVYFLAAGSPNLEHAVKPAMYYRLERNIKQHEDMSPFSVGWSSSAFMFFFSQCWIDYRTLGVDNPQAFGVEKPPIDWFENSRRAMLTHRQRCIDASADFKTFGSNRWGLSPAADINEKGEIGYIVPSVRPNIENNDNFCGGTITPYAAGSAIMFMPKLSLAALREFRHLKDKHGRHVVWRDPKQGGYGLLDSFNLDREEFQGTPDYLSIDEGPMILAIENARSGLIWKLFMEHPSARLAVSRLKLGSQSPSPQ